MQHFIETRFNISYSWIPAENRQNLNAEWLEYKLNLFLKYTAPSVLGQDRGNFYWCIFFDKKTPIEIIDKIKSVDKRIKTFNSISEYVKKRKLFIKNNDYFSISRLDSDDIYNKSFLTNINDFKTNKDILYDINFYCIDEKTKNICHKKNTNLCSHFISIITRNKEFNIYKNNHLKFFNNFCFYRDNSIMALELIHDKNIKNLFNDKEQINTNLNLSDFGINNV